MEGGGDDVSRAPGASWLTNNQTTATSLSGADEFTVIFPIPGSDLKEYTDKYELIVDMPGLTSTDIKIRIGNGPIYKELVITGERNSSETTPPPPPPLKNILAERAKILERRFDLPVDAIVRSVSAVCEEGLLVVTLPKFKYGPRIKIQGSKRKYRCEDSPPEANSPHHRVKAALVQAQTSHSATSISAPCTDIKEYTDKYEIVVDMPGLASDEIDVHLDYSNRNELVIRGIRSLTTLTPTFVRYLLAERSKVLERVIKLPIGADVNLLSAACYDGLLTVIIPKTPTNCH